MKNKISRRGFASLSEDERRRVARKGGKAAHRMGRAHEFTTEEAPEAGRKGGKAKAVNEKRKKERMDS